MRRIFVSAAICATLAGCASQVLEQKATRSYMIGQRTTASVGSPLLRIERGSVSTVRKFVGFLQSSDGWATEKVYSSDYYRGELIYSGISGKTIEVTYREFRNELAAPAFFQAVKYDLTNSEYISFQNFRLQVLSATSNGIETVLVSDSGPK